MNHKYTTVITVRVTKPKPSAMLITMTTEPPGESKHRTVITTVRMTKPRPRAILITVTTEPRGELKTHNSYYDCEDAKSKGDTDHNDYIATW